MRFRSINSYQIKEDKHQHFLLEERNDPVTGDSFLEGDEVVFCSVCKSAFLKDSWAYMGNKHCDQKATLPIFPKTKKMVLQKPIELPFVFPDTDNRTSAFFADILIFVGISSIIAFAAIKLHIILSSYFYAFLIFILITFRDIILINKSIGKAFQKMYFIDVETNLPATVWQVLGRNLLYWVMNGVFALLFIITNVLGNHIGDTILLYFFIAVFMLGTNIFYIKFNIKNNYSWFDKLLGIRLVKKK
ncbi:hypothetical protein Fleli_3100 [Bernardetia litoralis DSM 6794]|uniref:RDD domain-containing protein n=1 Tax=Bernardetia litoralis (strain ATCC 23117 / DSM 6794 / NBRC 15988 / NCIMB 1366 / Fx l1 / Sio-4) TaxID=880071 RepID=I4ANA5_BERLS|nr:hypothetical protein [Bernardetia litoralis]AFM05440.1 hypothetical protein Fleli_3100 [Bernardetia litoralis DSM 6794]